MTMKIRLYPLACPKCGKNDWDALRASDTGALGLECIACCLFVDFGAPQDVPTFTGKPIPQRP